jgi:hypothetical protein
MTPDRYISECRQRVAGWRSGMPKRKSPFLSLWATPVAVLALLATMAALQFTNAFAGNLNRSDMIELHAALSAVVGLLAGLAFLHFTDRK